MVKDTLLAAIAYSVAVFHAAKWDDGDTLISSTGGPVRRIASEGCKLHDKSLIADNQLTSRIIYHLAVFSLRSALKHRAWWMLSLGRTLSVADRAYSASITAVQSEWAAHGQNSRTCTVRAAHDEDHHPKNCKTLAADAPSRV